jgi:predicted NBD/HSP70 family sugar kinase
MAKQYAVGVDLGGTKILAALVTRKGKLIAETKQPTGAEDGPTKIIERIADGVDKLLHVAEQSRYLRSASARPARSIPRRGSSSTRPIFQAGITCRSPSY